MLINFRPLFIQPNLISTLRLRISIGKGAMRFQTLVSGFQIPTSDFNKG